MSENSEIKVKHLKFYTGEHVYRIDCGIKALIDQEVNCAEFTLKKTEQLILHDCIPYDKEGSKLWQNMVHRVFQQIVNLWNNEQNEVCDSEVKVLRLLFKDVSGAGAQIHAETNSEELGTVTIATEPWIQFAPKSWQDMVNNSFRKMVDLWNEEYGMPEWWRGIEGLVPYNSDHGDFGECIKCGAISGDAWLQCGGECPVPQSPHYKKGLAEKIILIKRVNKKRNEEIERIKNS